MGIPGETTGSPGRSTHRHWDYCDRYSHFTEVPGYSLIRIGGKSYSYTVSPCPEPLKPGYGSRDYNDYCAIGSCTCGCQGQRDTADDRRDAG